MDKKQLLVIAAAGSVATIVGVILPWATFSNEGLGAILAAAGQSTSVSGIEGTDGKLVLVLALVGAAVAGAQLLGRSLPLAPRKAMLIAMIGLALAAVISVIDFLNISGPVSVGIGLWLCVAGSIAAAATTFLAWKQMGAEPAAAGA